MRKLALLPGDGDVAVAAERVQDPAYEVGFGFLHDAGRQGPVAAESAFAFHHAPLDLLQRKGDQRDRAQLCALQRPDEEFELAGRVDMAGMRDAADQPIGIGIGDVAGRLRLVHDVVGERFHEESRPRRIALAGEPVVERKQHVGVLRRHDAFPEHAMPQPQHIVVRDLPAGQDGLDLVGMRHRALACVRRRREASRTVLSFA
jgi:hypothetical protein